MLQNNARKEFEEARYERVCGVASWRRVVRGRKCDIAVGVDASGPVVDCTNARGGSRQSHEDAREGE